MHHMKQYQRLCEESRNLRRTIADAVDVLREIADLNEHSRAEVRACPLRLPSGDLTGLVDVLFDVPFREEVSIVSLPTSARFRAIFEGSSRPDYFEISRLDGAIVGTEANVLLTDGTKRRAVEVIPTRLPINPTELDWRIVHHTISIIGAEDRCYRNLREGLPPHLQDMIPDRRFIDCSRLSGLDLPPLKVIASLIAERDKTLCKLSPQTVADALRKFGMRLPSPRPRLN
jgi:hypothetical protein